jgi:hypothetical protein
MGMSTSETTSAVASYKDDRGRLLNRYARPWLEALCFLDPIAYGDVAYERSKIIEHRYESIDLPKGPEAAAVIAQIALTRLTALADADVMFMSLTNIITNWIDDLGAVLDSGTVFKHLPRLARHAATSGDLWRDMESVSDDGPDSFAHVCLWLRALTFSGVKVPWEVITRLADKHAVGRKADDALFNLVVAVDANTEPMEQEPFAQLCNTIFTPLATSMASSEVAPTPQEVEMLTITMMSLLKAYGASPEAVAETTLASQGQSKILARRKVIAWPVAIAPLHPDIVFAAARILKHKANPGNIVLDILWLLFTKAPGVEDVQGLLHEVCPELSSIVWKLYDRHDIDRHSRSRLFLKLLTINNKPIEEVVAKESKGTLVRETRERLFQFVLQLADESLGTDVKNWRRAAVGLITIFFESALQPLDPSPETLPIWKGLLPTQLRAISTCFEEFLETSLDEHRVQLILKLLRIRSHLPHWPGMFFCLPQH